jgi:thioredoxin 2
MKTRQQMSRFGTRLVRWRDVLVRSPGRSCMFFGRMDTIVADEQGLLIACPQCAQRNRMRYEALGRTFRCGKCRAELPPPGEPVDVADERSFAALIVSSPLPVLVDFWAAWCGPCKMVAPEFAKLARDAAGTCIVVKVNTEQLPQLAARFRVTSIPLMVVLHGGAELARQAGAMPAARIRQFLDAALSSRRR